MSGINAEVLRVDTILAEGHPQLDGDGLERVETATCGTCGRSWNDARISALTPAPAGRCPYERAHETRPEPGRGQHEAGSAEA